MSDAYALLGVPKTASTAQIRDAYKEKAMMNHPDRGGDVAMWGQLQKAYDILSDPARRAEYDSNGSVRDGSS
jgi:curved DNA-binding protein CbpA